MGNIDWDDNQWPLAYLITFRTYGTWLHGDERFSVDRHGKNLYGAPAISPNEKLVEMMASNQVANAFLLDGLQRGVVENAIKNCCDLRGYRLPAINVRTNHVHAITAAARKPEGILSSFKANSTRELRNADLVQVDQPVWSRGGSTRYLWKPNHVEAAIDYVLNGQGEDLPNF